MQRKSCLFVRIWQYLQTNLANPTPFFCRTRKAASLRLKGKAGKSYTAEKKRKKGGGNNVLAHFGKIEGGREGHRPKTSLLRGRERLSWLSWRERTPLCDANLCVNNQGTPAHERGGIEASIETWKLGPLPNTRYREIFCLPCNPQLWIFFWRWGITGSGFIFLALVVKSSLFLSSSSKVGILSIGLRSWPWHGRIEMMELRRRTEEEVFHPPKSEIHHTLENINA